MSTKEVVYNLRDDKQELQKQLGCMNGIFQMFDRRYLLGQRCHGQKQKSLPQGKSDDNKKEFSNTSEQAKEKNTKRFSFESSRNSVSSSCSSLDCSKRVQTESSSEPYSSPILHKRQDFFIQSPDIRDVVKDSMIREPRVVSIKTFAKDERPGRAMKHVDSPRPFPTQKYIQYEEKDRYLAKEVKDMSRCSCDGRDSRNLSKSSIKVKELPRFSLDSKQTNGPSVVARLMGLDVFTSSIDKGETLKIKPCFNEELVSKSRLSRKREELKLNHDHISVSVSPRVRQRGVSSVITKIPLETAPWKSGRASMKPPFKNREASCSIYGEIEKRLTEHEFKTSGKDLRALKQILEAMQKTRRRLENNEPPLDHSGFDHKQSQKSYQSVSPTIRRREFLTVDIKPPKITLDSVMINGLQKVNHADHRKDLVGSQRVFRKSTGGPMSPKMQRSKNGTDKPSIRGPSSEPRRVKKQPTISKSTAKNAKTKPVSPVQNSEESYGYSNETKNLSQLSDAGSFQSETNSFVSQNDSEVTSAYRPKENSRNNNIAERLTDHKSVVDLAKHTMEQPSPVSVLDAFYTEDTPSPVKKKSNAFNDDDNSHFEAAQDQARIDNLDNNMYQDRYSEFNNVKLENIKNLVHQIELLNSTVDDTTINHTSSYPCEGETQDHRYVTEVLLASGLLNDLEHTIAIVQLHPTVSLISPDLFHVLEKTKGPTKKIRRKLVFDTVNDILGRKLGSFGPWNGKNKAKFLNGEKLIKEVCLEIENLETNKEKGIYDEDDEVINIISADVNKRSRNWDECCFEVPGLVLDIERLIFKDLISEVVNAEVTGVQDWPGRHRRQLFSI